MEEERRAFFPLLSFPIELLMYLYISFEYKLRCFIPIWLLHLFGGTSDCPVFPKKWDHLRLFFTESSVCPAGQTEESSKTELDKPRKGKKENGTNRGKVKKRMGQTEER